MTPESLPDVCYVRNFLRETAPAWLDHVALISGIAPPRRPAGFSWCDLGCGPGTNAAIIAATHPQGRFHGIDSMPEHIEEARRLAHDAQIPNLQFLDSDFSAATALDSGGFDYIVSHGVYTWIDQTARDHWLGFIDRHLKPGGMVYVSYNAMPGRAADLPLQRLVRALGRTLSGDSRQRVASALEVVEAMTELKAPSLVASPMLQWLKNRREPFNPSYLAHEFMVPGWDPQCVTDVRAHLATVGLKPVGSATLLDNHDRFVLGRASRDLLSRIADPDSRELARDFLIDQFFRRDVFVRGPRRMESDERRARLMNSTFLLTDPADEVKFHMATPAGRLSFDNPAARHIVKALAAGPRRLSELTDAAIPERDLLANALTLSAALAIWPVEGGAADVERINRAIQRRAGSPEQIPYRVLNCGTALRT